jgi:rhodanese-related sulfurtransferase
MAASLRVSPAEADRLMREEGYVYVDVRSVAEFEAGHPAGAYNVPVSIPGPSGLRENPDFLAVACACFAKSQPLVVGCKSGDRSARAARMLAEAGFERVIEQRAGMGGARDPFGRVTERGWEALGLPCATRAEPGRDYEALRRRLG